VAAGGPVARSFAGAAELSFGQLRDASVHWPRPSVLDASLKAIDGVGPRLAEAAAEAFLKGILKSDTAPYQDRYGKRLLPVVS